MRSVTTQSTRFYEAFLSHRGRRERAPDWHVRELTCSSVDVHDDRLNILFLTVDVQDERSNIRFLTVDPWDERLNILFLAVDVQDERLNILFLTVDIHEEQLNALFLIADVQDERLNILLLTVDLWDERLNICRNIVDLRDDPSNHPQASVACGAFVAETVRRWWNPAEVCDAPAEPPSPSCHVSSLACTHACSR